MLSSAVSVTYRWPGLGTNCSIVFGSVV